jgi:hypothetical protein
MTQMIDNPEKKNTIFTHAIDQNYQNLKENTIDFHEENYDNFFENGELKLNLDFIEISDELIFNSISQHKSSEGNLSNSCESSASTDFDNFSMIRSKSENTILTEKKKSFKIKNFLCSKFEDKSNKNLSSEIQKLKENLKEATKTRIFYSNNNNKINSFANFSIRNTNQNEKRNFCPQGPQCQINMIPTNFALGFFQQQPLKQNLNLESSVFKKERKYSYQAAYTSCNYLDL